MKPILFLFHIRYVSTKIKQIKWKNRVHTNWLEVSYTSSIHRSKVFLQPSGRTVNRITKKLSKQSTKWTYLFWNVPIIVHGRDSWATIIRIRSSLPFRSLRTNEIFRFLFTIKHVQGVNIVLLVNSWVTCQSKFIYRLEDSEPKIALHVNYSIHAGIENKPMNCPINLLTSVTDIDFVRTRK